jgi:hypothetical protein
VLLAGGRSWAESFEYSDYPDSLKIRGSLKLAPPGHFKKAGINMKKLSAALAVLSVATLGVPGPHSREISGCDGGSKEA